MSGPLITDLPLWERHVERVLENLRSALLCLRANTPQGDELKLNRELYLCMLEVNAANQKSGDFYFEHGPIPEGQNPPTPETEDSASERKIPDLRWEYIDHRSSDGRRGVRSFTIECKRLWCQASSGRYVKEGVCRFVSPDSRYGNGVAAGAMVGYIESLTLLQIVAQVNTTLQSLSLPTLSKPSRPSSALIEMEHLLSRPFKVSPFRLLHFWIDIRPTGGRTKPVGNVPQP